MPTSTMSQEMQNYFRQLNDAEKKSLLEMVKTFISGRKSDMQPQSLDEYNQELEQADAEIEAGDYVTDDDVMNRFLKQKQ